MSKITSCVALITGLTAAALANANECLADKFFAREEVGEILKAQKLGVAFFGETRQAVVVPHAVDGLTDAADEFPKE